MVKTGKVLVNGEEVKSAYNLKIGQSFTIKKNTAIFSYEVVDLLEKRVGAKLVSDYLRDVTSEEELEKYKEYQMAQREYRDLGYGKPSKKARRDRKKFLGE